MNYTNETGYSYWLKKNTTQHGWRYMDSIKQSTVFLAYSNSTKISTSFYWYKTYGWSPGHTSFMDNCDVVIANLGLHYQLSDGFLSNNNRHPPLKLDTDLLGMITYLTDFASSGDNKAIYRTALPQHFNTSDGHFDSPGDSKTCSLQHRKPEGSNSTMFQNYNRIYNKAFATLCNTKQHNSSDCGPYMHTCTVNRTNVEYPTVYKYYVDSQCCEKRLERYNKGNGTVTGTILRWNIADLFDEPQWHASTGDCSHFCYIPALYEAAFERLDLLLQ